MEQTEIRHATLNGLQSIARVLEEAQSWKKLMACIPSDLNDPNSRPKYNSDHISLIETESTKQKRFCAEILFEEWGTSGKVRPTLGHLLKILMDSELFRAADLVAVDLLNRPPVERPSTGIAAKVDTSLTNLILDKNLIAQDTEKFLDNMPYPDSIRNMQTFDRNLNQNIQQDNSSYSNKMSNLVKNLSYEESDKNGQSDKNVESKMTISTNLDLQSDMMKFSITQENFTYQNPLKTDEIPQFSMLLNNDQDTSEIHLKSKSTSEIPNLESEATNSDVLSNILSEAQFPVETNPLNSIQSADSFMIPHLSMLQNTTDTQDQEEFFIPNFSALQNNSIQYSSSNVSRTETLNTKLPHFQFIDLENATENFTTSIYDSPNENDLNNITYLAKGLFKQPVIVKKLKSLHLSGDSFDSLIIRQFKAEVEVMSKYNHENVLTLLGYSWDGPNYCLIYEYLDGGTLRQNLIDSHELKPLSRTNIAYGIAKGIEYLHSNSVIHGDIKSCNILLTKDKIPKLCDFGLVRQLSNQNANSNAIKTSVYLPPEALEGNVSAKTDVYSFGVILLELLMGLVKPDMGHSKTNDVLEQIQKYPSSDDFRTYMDPIMKEWSCSEKLYMLTKTCLGLENQRPPIENVVEKLKELV